MCFSVVQCCTVCMHAGVIVFVKPSACYQVWLSIVDAYVKLLCLQKQFLKAASHLLSINKVYEAIDLLMSHQLYRSFSSTGYFTHKLLYKEYKSECCMKIQLSNSLLLSGRILDCYL